METAISDKVKQHEMRDYEPVSVPLRKEPGWPMLAMIHHPVKTVKLLKYSFLEISKSL